MKKKVGFYNSVCQDESRQWSSTGANKIIK